MDYHKDIEKIEKKTIFISLSAFIIAFIALILDIVLLQRFEWSMLFLLASCALSLVRGQKIFTILSTVFLFIFLSTLFFLGLK